VARGLSGAASFAGAVVVCTSGGFAEEVVVCDLKRVDAGIVWATAEGSLLALSLSLSCWGASWGAASLVGKFCGTVVDSAGTSRSFWNEFGAEKDVAFDLGRVDAGIVGATEGMLWLAESRGEDDES